VIRQSDTTTRLCLMTTTSHIRILHIDFGLWTVEEWSNGLFPPLGTQIKNHKTIGEHVILKCSIAVPGCLSRIPDSNFSIPDPGF
jgi:hypothetical protein